MERARFGYLDISGVLHQMNTPTDPKGSGDKRAEEIAREIFLRILPIYRERPYETYEGEVELIAKALEEYAEQRRIEETVRMENIVNIREAVGRREGAASMREMCAKVADTLSSELDEESADKVFGLEFKKAIKGMNGSVVAEECAERIRLIPLTPSEGNGRGEG